MNTKMRLRLAVTVLLAVLVLGGWTRCNFPGGYWRIWDANSVDRVTGQHVDYSPDKRNELMHFYYGLLNLPEPVDTYWWHEEQYELRSNNILNEPRWVLVWEGWLSKTCPTWTGCPEPWDTSVRG